MTERERMDLFTRLASDRNLRMMEARYTKRNRHVFASLYQLILQTAVADAREANRQAVRLWHGRTVDNTVDNESSD